MKWQITLVIQIKLVILKSSLFNHHCNILLTFQAYVDIDEVTKVLHQKFPEYQRYKYKQFNKIVTQAYEKLCAEMTKKLEAESKKQPESKKEEVQIDSSDSENSSPKVSSTNMSKTMSDLYNTPKTEFEKVKEMAKNVQNGTKKPSEIGRKSAEPVKKPAVEPVKKPTEPVKKPTEPVNKPVDSVKKSEAVSRKPSVETIDLDPEPKAKETKEATPPPAGSTKSSRAASPTPLKIARKRKYENAFKEVSTDFTNVAGMEDTLKSLLRLMIGLKVKKAAKNQKRVLLLHGPTGCGKTLLANAIAGQLKWPLLEINATEIVSGM